MVDISEWGLIVQRIILFCFYQNMDINDLFLIYKTRTVLFNIGQVRHCLHYLPVSREIHH